MVGVTLNQILHHFFKECIMCYIWNSLNAILLPFLSFRHVQTNKKKQAEFLRADLTDDDIMKYDIMTSLYYQQVATGNENVLELDPIVSWFETHNETGIHRFSTVMGIDRHQH